MQAMEQDPAAEDEDKEKEKEKKEKKEDDFDLDEWNCFSFYLFG